VGSNDFSVTRFMGSDYSAVLPMIPFLFIMGFKPSSLTGLQEKENYIKILVKNKDIRDWNTLSLCHSSMNMDIGEKPTMERGEVHHGEVYGKKIQVGSPLHYY
jgi:hypothetical protein